MFPDATSAVILSGVVVHNPASPRVAVGFSVNGRSYNLASGKTQTFQSGNSQIIEFRRGPENGTVRYNISAAGTYSFKTSQAG